MSSSEYFPNVPKIEYKPEAPVDDAFCFRHYNANQVILGKPMKDWLRFSVCYWHTFVGAGGLDPFGKPTYERPWEAGVEDPMDLAKRRIDVAFEFFVKLGVQFYTFHDYDVAPEGATLEESHRNLDEISDYLLQKQQETGVQLLWATQNLFSHPRYMNGAATSPDLSIYCYAAAQIQKMLDIGTKLGALNHVFWGGREGYQSLSNSDIKLECDNMAALFHMVVEYQKRHGQTAQLLLEPKPREPCKHQYDYDAQTTLAFLHQYKLIDHFQLNIEPNHTTLAGHAAEHDVVVAAAYGKLGSIDSNTGDTLLGWDTDNFPMDLQQTTAIMGVLMQHGGFRTGGLNFDCKARRESIEPADLFLGHIGAMDCYALGLIKAAEMMQAGILSNMLKQRYLTWSGESSDADENDMAAKIKSGQATLEDCTAFALKKGEPEAKSGKQELFEMIRNRQLYQT